MSEYSAMIQWQRGNAAFTDKKYSRLHQWSFDGGITVPASSSPHSVPVPMSDPAAVDPEEALVASVSSCHMLWFLALAAVSGFTVDSYEDEAVGTMTQDERKVWWISRIRLNPRIRYGGDLRPSQPEEQKLHHEAHQRCYIANSIKAEVVIG